MDDRLSSELWDELERVARDYGRGLDLRYDQGPFLKWLDALVSPGLVDFTQGDPGYFVSYEINAAGLARLNERPKNQPPQAAS
jgi:hypothetical protein